MIISTISLAPFMRWNGLLAGFEARSRRVRFPLGAPSFASVDVEKIKPRKLDEDKARPLESKYQLLLRTSNLPGLVSTGKMIANEGGAITCKFINGVEASTVMPRIVNPTDLFHAWFDPRILHQFARNGLA